MSVGLPAQLVLENPTLLELLHLFRSITQELGVDLAVGSIYRFMEPTRWATTPTTFSFSSLVTIEACPLAHHYMGASLLEQAIPYWQQASQCALERSANLEAIGHLSKGLDVLKRLPVTPEHTHQELALLTSMGALLVIVKGYAAPEVRVVYSRARELCQRVEEMLLLSPVLWGLWMFYFVRGE